MWTPEHRARVGELIAREVERRGWTKTEAAHRLQVTDKTIQRARKGDALVSAATIVRIARALDISETEITPPRAPEEQSQLDRIEETLSFVLEACSMRLLHELLPALRKEAGLTQSDLSFETANGGGPRVPTSTIHSYEQRNGIGRIPDAEILESLARALSVQPDVFYEWPIAQARREARPSATRHARKAAQRLDETQPTSRRNIRARDDESQDS
jgi:transcriptional regulator with XRE-family HTH domain